MKYLIFFLILGLASISLLSNAWSEDMQMHKGAMQMNQEKMQMHNEEMQMNKESSSAVNEDKIEDVGNEICPVSGEPVDKNVSYVYEGKRYYFCCPMCIEEFKKDPGKYIKKIEEEKQKETTKEQSEEKSAVPEEHPLMHP